MKLSHIGVVGIVGSGIGGVVWGTGKAVYDRNHEDTFTTIAQKAARNSLCYSTDWVVTWLKSLAVFTGVVMVTDMVVPSAQAS